MLNSVTEKTLAAYKEALANFPSSHFAVTSLASVIIRLGGREGRVAVQAAQREKTAARPVLVPSQDTPQKRAFRKLEFSKKNDQDEAPVKTSNFGLKRVSKAGKVTPMDQEETDLPEQPLSPQTSGEQPGLPTSPQSNDKSENAADKNETDLTDGAQGDSEVVEGVALVGEALEALKSMKPAAIGRSFSLEDLRATLTSLGVEYSDAHTPTILGAALLSHLKGK